MVEDFTPQTSSLSGSFRWKWRRGIKLCVSVWSDKVCRDLFNREQVTGCCPVTQNGRVSLLMLFVSTSDGSVCLHQRGEKWVSQSLLIVIRQQKPRHQRKQPISVILNLPRWDYKQVLTYSYLYGRPMTIKPWDHDLQGTTKTMTSPCHVQCLHKARVSLAYRESTMT